MTTTRSGGWLHTGTKGRNGVEAPLRLPVDACIEQTKGVLVAAFRLPPDAALELLTWRAEETRVGPASTWGSPRSTRTRRFDEDQDVPARGPQARRYDQRMSPMDGR